MTVRAVVAAVVLAIALDFPAAAIDRGGKGPVDVPVNVSGTATDSLSPVVAVAGDTVHVAWIESEPTTDGLRATIWYARSVDGGATFESGRPIAPLTGYASGLQCATVGATLHLVWLATSYTTGSPAAVDYQRSSDGGETFEPYVAVNGSEPPGAPILVASGANVGAVWHAEDRIRIARSADGGSTFDAASIGETDSSRARAVRAVASPNGILLAWLTPAQATGAALGVGRVEWNSGDLLESPSPDPVAVTEVSIAANGDTAVVAWVTAGEDRVAKGSISTDGGVSFDAPFQLGSAGGIAAPNAAAGSRYGYITWIDPRGRVRVSRLGSEASPMDIRMRSNKRAVFPEIAVDGDGAVMAWRSGSGQSSRVRVCVIGPGDNSTVGVTLARPGRSAAAPRVAMVDSRSIVVWQEISGGAAEVFAARIPR